MPANSRLSNGISPGQVDGGSTWKALPLRRSLALLLALGAASAEATRQYSAWRGRGAGSGSGPGRLRLVAPNETGNGSSATAARLAAAGGEAAEVAAALSAQVAGILQSFDRARGLLWPRHVDWVGETFGDLVDGWVPQREPLHWALRRHLRAEAPPGGRDLKAAVQAVRAAMLADGEAWRLLRGTAPVATWQTARAIVAKMERRHPHVFGDADARSAGVVKDLWEQIKAEERAAKVARGSTSAAKKPAGRSRRIRRPRGCCSAPIRPAR